MEHDNQPHCGDETVKSLRILSQSAFSLVEVLAAVAIIGIVTFLAIPNIVQVKQDSEDNMARVRANVLNMAIASFVQAKGQATATNLWSGASDSARYSNLSPYIAFPDPTWSAFTLSPTYTFTLPTTISPLTTNTTIMRGTNAIKY